MTRQMVGLAYKLLSAVVGLGGFALAVFAFVGLPFQSSAGLDLLRTRARWAYVVIAILSFVISMGDLPRNRRDADLLWVVPGNIVFEGALWPLALGRRIAPWEWEEY